MNGKGNIHTKSAIDAQFDFGFALRKLGAKRKTHTSFGKGIHISFNLSHSENLYVASPNQD